MKSAYELAMERLNKQSPSVQLTADQKKQIAELDSQFKARTAERELALGDAIMTATAKGNFEEAEKLQKQLGHEKQKIAEELETKRDAVRQKRN